MGIKYFKFVEFLADPNHQCRLARLLIHILYSTLYSRCCSWNYSTSMLLFPYGDTIEADSPLIHTTVDRILYLCLCVNESAVLINHLVLL
jgi:hypothetical protein